MSAALGELRQRSQGLNRRGQIIASLGVVIAYFALMAWPDDPLEYGRTISYFYVPDILYDELTQFGVESTSTDILNGSLPSPTKALLFLVLPVLYLAAIIRRRWIVVTTLTVLTFLPWEALGQLAPMRSFMLIILVIFVPLQLSKLKFSAKVALAFVALSISPLVMSIAFQGPGHPVYGRFYVDYRKVPIKKVQDGQENGEQWRSFLADRVADDEKALLRARAFVQAQYGINVAKLGYAAHVLEEFQRSGGPANRFEKSLEAGMIAHLAASGVYAEAEQVRVLSAYRMKLGFSGVAFAIGVVLAFTSIFFDIVKTAISSRVARIGSLQEKLNPGEYLGRIRNAPGDGKTKIQSLAAMDARDAIAEISARCLRYRNLAFVALASAIMFLVLRQYVWLPDPASNTAFSDVALPGGVAHLGAHIGFFPPEDYGDPHPALMVFRGFSVSTLFFGIAAYLYFFLKKKVAALAALLVYSVVNLFAPVMFMPSAQYTVMADAIEPGHRAVLVERLGLPDRGELNGPDIGVLRSSFNTPEITEAERELWKSHKGRTKRQYFAFVLAQLAYLDNRPDQVSAALDTIDPEARFGMPYQMRRLAIIDDWLAANGYERSVNPKTVAMVVNSGVKRVMSLGLGLLAFAAFVAALGFGCLSVLLFKRRQRLEGMIEQSKTVRVGADRLRRALRV